jgi:hypothetical protein
MRHIKTFNRPDGLSVTVKFEGEPWNDYHVEVWRSGVYQTQSLEIFDERDEALDVAKSILDTTPPILPVRRPDEQISAEAAAINVHANLGRFGVSELKGVRLEPGVAFEARGASWEILYVADKVVHARRSEPL